MQWYVCARKHMFTIIHVCVSVFISGHYMARRLSSQQAFKPETARLCRDDSVLSAAAVCVCVCVSARHREMQHRPIKSRPSTAVHTGHHLSGKLLKGVSRHVRDHTENKRRRRQDHSAATEVINQLVTRALSPPRSPPPPPRLPLPSLSLSPSVSLCHFLALTGPQPHTMHPQQEQSPLAATGLRHECTSASAHKGMPGLLRGWGWMG